jgi:ketosteroid isomerase-like protein
MSQKDVKLVREAFGSEDLEETAQTYWHPEIEYIEDSRLPGASSYEGRDAVVAVWRSYLEVLDDEGGISTTVEDVREAGDRVVALVRFSGHASGSGIPFDHLWGYLIEVRDERIAYLRAFYESGEALEAAGLS